MDDFRNLHGQEKAGCCDLLLVSAARGRAKQLSTALAHWLIPRAKAFTMFTAWILDYQGIFRFYLLKAAEPFQEEKRLPCREESAVK